MDYISKEAKALNAEIESGNIPLRRLRLFLREVAEPVAAIPMGEVDAEVRAAASLSALRKAAEDVLTAGSDPCDYCGQRSSYDCQCYDSPKKHCEDCECYECYTICRDCGKTPHFDTSIKCEVCERVLDCCHASKDQSDRFCFSCEEAVRSVPNDYEEDYDEVVTWDRDCFYALTLRIGANNNREAEEDTDNVAEKVNCRAEALRLDKIASRLLMNHPSFKPWWIERWNWWGKGAQPSAAPAAAPLVPQPPHSPLKAPAPARPDYRHPHWPSPRAKLFANELSVETKFRKHEDALQFLASRASITVDELLKMPLQQYVKKHNGGRLPTHLRTERFLSGWGHHDTNY